MQTARLGSLIPLSGDWNTAGNWMPNTVPNGSVDTATFNLSNTTDTSNSASVEVNSIVFEPGASAYTITAVYPLTISGIGIANNSGVAQNFVAEEGFIFSPIIFMNNATAGNLTFFTNPAGVVEHSFGGQTNFLDASNGGNATIINEGAEGGSGGLTQFFGRSSAGNATVINQGAPPGDVIGGATYFFPPQVREQAPSLTMEAPSMAAAAA